MTMTDQVLLQADLTKVTVVETTHSGTSEVLGSKSETLLEEEYGWHKEYLDNVCGKAFKERHSTRNKSKSHLWAAYL